MVLFSALFATYASLVHATDGGPITNQLFDRNLVAIETVALLLSSFVCGLAMIAAKRKNMAWTQGWLLVTGLLGLVFLSIELYEFAHMIGEGAGPQRSAFLSAFFTLGRLPRRARHRRPAVDRDDDGADLGQGLSPGHRPPAAVPQHFLARARHHLGGHLHHRLSDRDIAMSERRPRS